MIADIAVITLGTFIGMWAWFISLVVVLRWADGR